MGKYFHSCIRFVFSKPPIAATIVGTAIHLFQALNCWIFMDTDYFEQYRSLLADQPLSGAFQVLIPYLVPFMITYIANRLATQREHKSLLRSPDAHPDMILKLDERGQVTYTNPATSEYLQRLDIDPLRPEQLLPDDYLNIVRTLAGSGKSASAEKKIRDTTLNLEFRSLPDVNGIFVSGREVKMERSLSALSDKGRKTENTSITGPKNIEVYVSF